MAESTATKVANKITNTADKGNGNFKQLFNQVKKVFFNSDVIENADFASGIQAEMELPILEGGVTFNGPTAEKTEIKLTDGTVWTSKKTLGDSDISFQIASVSNEIAKLFMEQKTTATANNVPGEITSSLGGSEVTFQGVGYAMGIKSVTGALIMFDSNNETMIVLPNVEMAGALNGADGDNPAYFNVTVTPLINAAGVNIYVFTKKTTA